MDHSWHQLSIATLGSGRARTRSGLAIPRVDERDHCAHVLGSFLALVCLERLPRAPTAILSAGTPDDIEACQQFGGRSGSAAADRPALFKNEPPRSRVCTLAQTRQSRLSEGHCPRRAGADPEKRIPATVASKMLDASDALGGVGRITFQMTSVSLETVAMKRSIELLGTDVAPIVRATRSNR
jgi:hypothetical protein